MSRPKLRAAIDIGGTFTDVQVLDPSTGAVWDFKAPTTPEDPSIGLIDGLAGAAGRHGFTVGDIGMILHGSTIATNAVLERKLDALAGDIDTCAAASAGLSFNPSPTIRTFCPSSES